MCHTSTHNGIHTAVVVVVIPGFSLLMKIAACVKVSTPVVQACVCLHVYMFCMVVDAIGFLDSVIDCEFDKGEAYSNSFVLLLSVLERCSCASQRDGTVNWLFADYTPHHNHKPIPTCFLTSPGVSC